MAIFLKFGINEIIQSVSIQESCCLLYHILVIDMHFFPRDPLWMCQMYLLPILRQQHRESQMISHYCLKNTIQNPQKKVNMYSHRSSCRSCICMYVFCNFECVDVKKYLYFSSLRFWTGDSKNILYKWQMKNMNKQINRDQSTLRMRCLVFLTA